MCVSNEASSFLASAWRSRKRRWITQASSRDVLYHSGRVDIGLLTDNRGSSTVDLDELAPDLLLNRLIVKLDHQVFLDLRLGI